MIADLHIHTWFSDGTETPEEVAEIASERGLSMISVCDHKKLPVDVLAQFSPVAITPQDPRQE